MKTARKCLVYLKPTILGESIRRELTSLMKVRQLACTSPMQALVAVICVDGEQEALSPVKDEGQKTGLNIVDKSSIIAVQIGQDAPSLSVNDKGQEPVLKIADAGSGGSDTSDDKESMEDESSVTSNLVPRVFLWERPGSFFGKDPGIGWSRDSQNLGFFK